MNFVDLFVDDTAPEEPEPPVVPHERPVWLGPPTEELGAAVPVGLVLARSERGVVAVSHALVYSTGVSFELVAQVSGLTPSESSRVFHEQHQGRLGDDDLPDGFVRFGIELPDGRRVSNLGGRRRLFGETEPAGPVLIQHGGGGGQSETGAVSWKAEVWLWPLPEPGALRLYAEWPIAGIGVSSHELDSRELLGAVANVVRLSGETPSGSGGGWISSSSVGQVVMAASAPTGTPAADELDALEAALAAALRAIRRSRRRP